MSISKYLKAFITPGEKKARQDAIFLKRRKDGNTPTEDSRE